MSQSHRRLQRQRGYVLIMMGALSVAVLGASGLALDLGRVFIGKQESQAFVDSAAIAAALELDGTQTGLTRARAAAVASGNRWNMNMTTVPTPTVEFASAAGGPWAANPANASGLVYARVAVTLPERLYFLPIISRQYSQNVVSRASAAQLSINSFSKGLAPYTAVAQNNAGPNFGLTRGVQYTIQWPAMTTNSSQCKQNNAKNCFVKDPCAGDLTSNNVMWKVAQNWGSNTSGYWGFGNSSQIEQSILDGLQPQPITVGDNISPIMSSGTMNSQAGYLDERVRQDTYNGSNYVDQYMSSPNHNGRRLLIVPVVEPVNPNNTIVRGFATFLLLTNGNSSNEYTRATNGNDAYCGVYIGPYTIGSNDSGGATSGSGAYRVTLVE